MTENKQAITPLKNYRAWPRALPSHKRYLLFVLEFCLKLHSLNAMNPQVYGEPVRNTGRKCTRLLKRGLFFCRQSSR